MSLSPLSRYEIRKTRRTITEACGGLVDLTDPQLAALMRFSELILRAEYRLVVAASVTDLGWTSFSNADVFASSPSQVRDQRSYEAAVSRNLKVLADGGVLVKSAKGLWHRTDSPFWQFVEALVLDIRRKHPAGVG